LHTVFLSISLKARDHAEDLGIDDIGIDFSERGLDVVSWMHLA
jgi:hypothetical protein